MSHENHPATTAAQPTGVPRRRVLLNTAGIAAAGLVVGAAVPIAVGTAADRPTEPEAAHGNRPASPDPVVVHLRDANAGQFDMFVGTRHVRFTDRAFAARLTQVATDS